MTVESGGHRYLCVCVCVCVCVWLHHAMQIHTVDWMWPFDLLVGVRVERQVDQVVEKSGFHGSISAYLCECVL